MESCINGVRSSDTTIQELELHYNRPIKIRLEVHGAAVNRRGLNLLGTGYGDYPQSLKLLFVHQSDQP